VRTKKKEGIGEYLARQGGVLQPSPTCTKHFEETKRKRRKRSAKMCERREVNRGKDKEWEKSLNFYERIEDSLGKRRILAKWRFHRWGAHESTKEKATAARKGKKKKKGQNHLSGRDRGIDRDGASFHPLGGRALIASKPREEGGLSLSRDAKRKNRSRKTEENLLYEKRRRFSELIKRGALFGSSNTQARQRFGKRKKGEWEVERNEGKRGDENEKKCRRF